MKYIILLGDGMADYPVDELNGKTPLECAKTPNMDMMAQKGTIGLVDTIPKGFPPGSDVANLSVLGYNPEECYTGRGPLEAASMNVKLGPDDWAFRCNLVTLSNDVSPVMDSSNAGHITSEEAKKIIDDINDKLGSETFDFYPGVSYRHLMVWRNATLSLDTTPPHDIVGQEIKRYLPKGDDAKELVRLMKLSRDIMKDHPVNQIRISQGKKPANSIWLWGEGRAPAMNPITSKFNIKGGVISAVDLLRGIGTYAGLDILHVDGATGYTDTNYRGKAEKALEYLRDHDFIFLHVESPDEMGHEGNAEGKIKAIEDFDEMVVGTILKEIKALGEFRVMVLSDHPTPIIIRTHVSDPSPFAVWSSVEGENLKNGESYNETAAKNSGITVSPGYQLMNNFMQKWREFVEQNRG